MKPAADARCVPPGTRRAWVCALMIGAVALPPLVFPAAARAASPSPVPEASARDVMAFLTQNCQRCHRRGKATAGFRVDELRSGRDLLDAQVGNAKAQARWIDVANQLSGGHMPPATEPQPKSDASAAVLAWITAEMTKLGPHVLPAPQRMRRLNREEYRNTVRDLTGVDPDIGTFPLDPAVGGFSNNGGSLVVSPLHIELLADIAKAVLDRALVSGSRPETIRWRFEPETGSGDDHRIDLAGNQHPIVHGAQNRKEDGFTIIDGGPGGNPNVRDFEVPTPGDYIIRVRAGGRIPARAAVERAAELELSHRRQREDAERPADAAFHRDTYEHDLRHFRTDPMYSYSDPRLRFGLVVGPKMTVLAEFDVDAPADAPKVYEFRVTLPRQRLDMRLEYAYAIPRTLENFWFQGNQSFPRPEIWLDWVEIEGPLYPSWPPASHTSILGTAGRIDDGPAGHPAVRQLLTRFMTRAYRGPVSAEEVERKFALYDRARGDQLPFIEAIKVPLQAILIAPRFLYLSDEPAPDAAVGTPAAPGRQPLDDYALASRLAYFLWSTIPDDPLLDLARAGKLQAPATLAREAARMLDDPRSRALAENFASDWLGLREVGTNPPVGDHFPNYDRHLETSMVQESRAFFDEILRHDRSVLDFIRSDWVIVNERLARFYGIEGVKGDAFRRVQVAPSLHRGGLLTQASMLSLTSNGTRTSPVKRGVWVLKTLLGADPGLPLDNVGEIPPRVPGVDRAPVRLRLQIHRSRPQCARCHQKIDPIGLALENYDGAGQWRDQEGFGFHGRIDRDDPKIDASAQIAGAPAFVGIEGLAAHLRARPDDFRRCLVAKMFAYALGRDLVFSDRGTLNAAAAHLKSNGDKLRALVSFIVTSDLFRSR
jgi:mono/diheme cytochrome c family protein